MDTEAVVPKFAVLCSPKNLYSVAKRGSAEYKGRIESSHKEVFWSTSSEECLNWKTSGQIFKEKFGYSKTFRRNMKKQGLNPQDPIEVASYKLERKKLKKIRKKVEKDHHVKSKLGRGAKKAKLSKPKPK